MAGVDDAALPEFHGPGDRAARGGRIQPEVVEDVVQAQHVFRFAQADHRAELADGDVFGTVALVVFVEMPVALDALVGAQLVVVDVGLGLVVAGIALEPHQRGRAPAALALRRHVILVAALHRALEAAVHGRAIGVEIVGVERLVPGRGLVVHGAQRAQYARRLVEEGRADLLQRILDYRGRGDLLADDLVVGLEFLRHRRLGRLALDHDGLEAQRAHLGAAAPARPDRLDAAHDAAAQHQVFAGRGDARQRHVLAFGAMEIALDGGGGIQVVEADIGRRVEEFDRVVRDLQQGPLCRQAVEHDMVVAETLGEGREVVSGAGIEEGVAVRRAAGEIAARGRGHAAGQRAGAEDQRDFGIERVLALIEQVVEQHHVGAATAEEAAHDFGRKVLAAGLAVLEVYEEHGTLGRVLRRIVHARAQVIDLASDAHRPFSMVAIR